MTTSSGAQHDTLHRDLVWVVDDSPVEAEIVRRSLEHRFLVQSFVDGETMLERLAEGPVPDLLLLDWHMPGLSGVEICRFIRQGTDEARLPIILLTAMTQDGEALVEGLASGANDFLTKPFRAEELLARVSALIRTKRVHEKLERAEDALRIEGDVRERFIGILGHDLRQPLNSLMIAGHVLTGRADTPEDKTTARIVVRSSQRMQRMIVELLDFTRVRQGGGIPIVRYKGSFHRIVAQVAEELGLANPERSVTIDPHGTGAGFWDNDRIAQLCSNLIGNALEHSPARSPVAVHVVEAGGYVELAVQNEGPPIAPSLLATLFDPFKRGAQTHSQGLGLGLFIADQIVRAHEGSMSVRSDATGTTFVARMPVAAAA